MDKSDTDRILNKLDEVKDTVGHLRSEVGELNIHVKGNGGLGLQQRVTNAEDWIKHWESTRPRVCPLDTEEIDRKSRRRIAIIGVALAAVTILTGVLTAALL